MKPNARSLILGLLLASESEELSAAEIISAARLMGVSENSARVALTRLSAEDKITSKTRGAYQLGPDAEPIADEVGSWRRREELLTPWEGNYVVVIAGPTKGMTRAQQRQRERGLRLAGLKALPEGLYIRPDNLQGSVSALQRRLVRLGLREDDLVFGAHSMPVRVTRGLIDRWEQEALDRCYAEGIVTLERWLEQAAGLPLERAARESYNLGNKAISDVIFDPLLPAPYVNAELRAAYFDVVRRFDRFGQKIWSQLLTHFRQIPILESELS